MRTMIISLVFPEFITMSFSWVYSVSASRYCCIKDWLRQRISVKFMAGFCPVEFSAFFKQARLLAQQISSHCQNGNNML